MGSGLLFHGHESRHRVTSFSHSVRLLFSSIVRNSCGRLRQLLALHANMTGPGTTFVSNLASIVTVFCLFLHG